MVDQTVNPHPVGAASRADVVANVVVNSEASRFLREILEKAIANPAGVAPRWLAETWALLANILVNDYLNNWNHAGKDDVRKAEEAVLNALAIDPRLALAHHANGLIHRARGQHQAALNAFERAVEFDPYFARAQAQLGNELVLLGRPGDATQPLEKVIELNQHHPAIGYFYWIIGRAYFFDEKYREAIPWLRKSASALPTVWYNRLYLVSALAHVGGTDGAEETVEAKTLLKEFLDHSGFGKHTVTRVASYEEANPNDHAMVVAGRKRFRDGLRKADMAP